MNKTLKAKWVWTFLKEDYTLWKNMVKVPCDVDRFGWWNRKSPHPHEVKCWKLVISGWDNFKNLVNFEVKNGSRVLFWYDAWCEDQPLKD